VQHEGKRLSFLLQTSWVADHDHEILWLLVALSILSILWASVSNAGAFLLTPTAQANGLDGIVHSKGYDGSTAILVLSVCVDPSSEFAAVLPGPMRQAIATWNELVPTTGTFVPEGESSEVPAGAYDAESTILHELGHCMGGLQHSNLGFELSFPQSIFFFNASFSTEGPNDDYDFDEIGPDGVWGSSDDQRGDDLNLVWFRKDSNDPFFIDPSPTARFDSTTYSHNLTDLPGSHFFAANGTPGVATRLGYLNTKAVMFAQGETQSEFRSLSSDDVATLRYAMSGLDELSGTGDDYIVTLQESDFPCDIPIRFAGTIGNPDAVAACLGVLSQPIGGTQHYTFFPTEIRLFSGRTFFFGSGPDLAVTKADGGVTPGAGEVLVYTIEVSNVGSLTSSGVELREIVPDNTTFSAADSDPRWSCSDVAEGSQCLLDVGTLASGDPAVAVTFSVRLIDPFPNKASEVSNIVFIQDDGANGPDTDQSNNNAQTSTPIRPGEVILSADFETGDTSQWTAVVGALRPPPYGEFGSVTR